MPRFPPTVTNTATLGVLLALSMPTLRGVSKAEASEDRSVRPLPHNVLFIVSDDLNTMLGCYGDPRAKTPHIDRLAARGVRFARAYCTLPLCGPSRNSFLTGLYPNSTGIVLNSQIFRQSIPEHPSLPECFRRQGGFAARIGKLYHYNVPTSIGTSGHDDPASWEATFNPAGVDRLEEEPRIFSLVPGQFGGTLSWYASPQSDERHTDGRVAAQAERVLELCAADPSRPFFVAVGFFRPHTPFVAPRAPYFDWYPVEDMPVVTGVEADQADLPAPALDSRKPEQERLTDDLRRQCLQAYLASISFMDAQLGRVLDALDRLGVAETTTIVFTSDHGYHMGEHGLWQKQSLFEESARVPLLVVAPGVSAPGTVVATPVSQVDLYPTIAELCGLDAPPTLQGQSLVPLLRDPTTAGRGWAVTQVVRRGPPQRANDDATRETFSGYSLRTPRWRYTEWDAGRRGRELYDHDADPRELVNLANDPAHAADVASLTELLAEAVTRTLPPSGLPPTVRDATWPPKIEAR
jgi:iduronate 2-sulfatase